MMTKDEALAALAAHAPGRRRPALVPLANCAGRGVAEDLAAPFDFPPFDKAVMDGWAVRSADVAAPVALAVAGRITAGEIGAPLRAGTAVKIMTGAPLPPDADAVLQVEESELAPDGGTVALRKGVRPWLNTARRGEDWRRGDVVVPRGTRIDATVQALVAMLGLDPVPSYALPTVCVVPTGDELVPPGSATVPPGGIFESNGTLVAALLRETLPDLRPTCPGIAPDERRALAAFLDVGTAHDVLILSGGVSMGDLDLVAPMLKERGLVPTIEKVAIKPGKPFLFGDIRRADGGVCTVFGLPGNPVSSCVTFELFVKPWLRSVVGVVDAPCGRATAIFAPATPLKAIPRTQHVPVRINVVDGRASAVPVRWNGSGDLRGLAAADGLAVIPAGMAGEPGAVVDIEPIGHRSFRGGAGA